MILGNLFRTVFLLFIISLGVNAQSKNEQIAENTTETVSARDLVLSSMKDKMPSTDLYDTWENTRCHAKTASVPETHKIDLRDFSMPIKQTIITSNFGPRWGRNHNGVDIKAYMTDTIYSAFKGVVRVVKNDPRGYGNVIVIRHYNGLETVYGHLSKQIVKANQFVESGQPIGIAGNTGRSTGTHLHFETRFCGIPINPQEIFSFKYKDVTSDYYIWKKKKSSH